MNHAEKRVTRALTAGGVASVSVRPVLRIAALTAVACMAGCQLLPRSEAARPVDAKAVQKGAADAYAEGNWAEAAQQYAILVKQMPEDAELWFRLGNTYARTNQRDRAIHAYQESLVRDPKLTKAWFNMGVVQLREAANSFREMRDSIGSSDPMYQPASEAYDGIMKILQPGRGRPASAPAGTAAPDGSSAAPVAAPAPKADATRE